MNKKIMTGAIISGIINGIINGGIQWFSFRKHVNIPISVDSISNDEFTVLGSAVHLAITLAMILTFVAYFSIPKENRPTYKGIIWLIVKHGFFTFGVITALSVMWQYYMGSLVVSPVSATIIVGVIAGIVALAVNYLTLEPYSQKEGS